MTTTHPYNFPILDTPLGAVHRLPTEYFLQHILPPLPECLDAETIVARIRRSGSRSHRPITKQGRWRGFAQNPAKMDRVEASSFTHFSDIVKAIARAGRADRLLPSLELLERDIYWPVDEARSREPDITSLPDAYMVERGTIPREATWSDFSVAGWYHKCGEIEDQEDVSHAFFIVESFSHRSSRIVRA